MHEKLLCFSIRKSVDTQSKDSQVKTVVARNVKKTDIHTHNCDYIAQRPKVTFLLETLQRYVSNHREEALET